MKKLSNLYIALILLFLFAPIAVLIVFSFNDGSSTSTLSGFSFKWYAELFRNHEILNALKNSLILALSSSAIATVLGTAAAFGIHHMKNKHARRSLMTATNIPMMNPEIITGISLMFLFVFVGTLLGLSTKLGFWTMLIAHITFNLPYVILNVLPKFKQMDKALPEAALDLGCTPMQSFFKVQLPAIMPGVLTGAIMAFTMSLDDFVISYFTSGVDFQTLPILIYSMTKKNVKPTIYALSTIIFVVILIMLLLSNREKTADERIQAQKIKEEKKRQEAILLAQKKRKQNAKNATETENRLIIQRKRPSYLTRILAIVCAVAVLISVCVVLNVLSKQTITLNVYNWGEYISDGSEDTLDTNRAFEEYCAEELGMKVKVNYVTYTSNEDLYAKLSTGAVSYDVIIPSDYMIARLASEGLLEELDFANIPNYNEAITEDFRNLYYDPENKYSVPYTYGMVGVIYNANVVQEADIGDWDLMWNEAYKGQIVQFNNSRDAFGTAFYKLGLDVNTTDHAAWDAGLDELKKQMPLLKKFVMDEIFNMMESGEAAIGAYYAGDYLTMLDNQAEHVDLQFYYPPNTNLFVDAMCVPKGCQNKELAEAYINFMLSREVAIANAEYICYACPNALVYNDEEYKEDMGEEAYQILYPEGFDFAASYDANCYKDLDKATKDYLNKKWEELRTSG
ncbi:MAG: extracellular solute-binding protein [Ruminococcaceae bacterium]|nr:extracellular solute-binding protein [Oscillospiraceae bacterium]